MSSPATSAPAAARPASATAAPAGAGSLLARVRSPADLRALDPGVLEALAEEIRSTLIETVTRTGGHLGPNLGVVELTLALHRVFDSPRDVLVWDTGHQAYVHKMLTGRADRLDTLRQPGGLSGYPSRRESPHDRVENSHASTALSYADGLAKALALTGQTDRSVVAVVGDGALTGGMCWEGLNALGSAPDRPVIVVLNDNGRSYAPTVGALAAQLARSREGDELGMRSVAGLVERLGLRYLGPIDGHDEQEVEQALRQARGLRRPVLVHCLTSKGRGYPPAEADQDERMHTIAPASPGSAASAASPVAPPPRPAWTQVFADALVEAARRRDDVVAITAAMPGPTGVARLARELPQRVHDVGIAEQHAVTSSAGLAMGGLHPVVAIYATFLNRAYDQVLMDVGLHRLPVTFVLDRAGITGNDGPSHHGMWDLGLLGSVPGMRVAAPRDGAELRALFDEAVDWDAGPTAVRFPKGRSPEPLQAIERRGDADLLWQGGPRDVLLLPVGPLAAEACQAAHRLAEHGLGASVLDPRWVLPVGPEIVDAAAQHALVVTVEDHSACGGFGDAVGRALRAAGVDTRLRCLALPPQYLPHGQRPTMLHEAGLDAAGIEAAVLAASGI